MTPESEVLLVGTMKSVNGAFCAGETVRLLLAFDGAGTERQPVRQSRRVIAGIRRFENRRCITVELTPRPRNSIKHRRTSHDGETSRCIGTRVQRVVQLLALRRVVRG